MEESFLPFPTTPCLPGRMNYVFVCFIISGGVRPTRKVKPVLWVKRTVYLIREGQVVNCSNTVIRFDMYSSKHGQGLPIPHSEPCCRQ